MIDCYAAKAVIHPCKLAAGMGHLQSLANDCFGRSKLRSDAQLIQLYGASASGSERTFTNDHDQAAKRHPIPISRAKLSVCFDRSSAHSTSIPRYQGTAQCFLVWYAPKAIAPLEYSWCGESCEYRTVRCRVKTDLLDPRVQNAIVLPRSQAR